MGTLNTDISLTNTSNSKALQIKTFSVTRSDTSLVTKAVLPARAIIVGAYGSNFSGTASNAGTTAAIDLKIKANGNSVALRSNMDVKSSGLAPSIGALINVQDASITGATTDIEVQTQYTETGAASTSGGPWMISILYTT